MSRLAELIEELCPDGVEYRPLGEIADLQRGSGMPKKLFVDEGIPAIHYGHIFTKYGIHTKCAAAYLAPEDADKLTHVYPGDLVVANTSENLEDVGKGVVWLGDVEGVTGGHATVVRSLAVDTVFLSYYLRTEDFALKKRKYAQGTKVIELSAANLSKIDIPVPPLEVQREIVRILDQFTTLEAELEAELEARQTQYEHYRNHLLSYESLAARGPVSWSALRELGVWSGGGTPSKSRGDYWVDGTIPWITPKDMRSSKIQDSMMNVTDMAVRESNVKLIEAPSIALVVRSSILQHTFPVAQIDVDATFNQDMKVLVVDLDRFERRYIYYALSANGQEILRQTSKQGGSVNSLVVPQLMDFEIPVPEIDEQRRIADLLDRFDALVNDITSGLPAEIAARRAQYEHYRDRLLSFPEKAVSGSDAS